MRTRASFSLAALLLVLSSAPALTALAQPIPAGEPSAVRFYQAPGRGFLMVDDSEVIGDLTPALGATFDYAHRPFALDDPDCITRPISMPCSRFELDVVRSVTTLQLTGAIGLADRVQIGLNVPVVLFTEGQGWAWTEGETPRSFPGGSGATLGDPRLHVLVSLIDPDEASGIGLGFVGWATAPLARAILPRRYVGDPSFAAGGHIVFSVRFSGFRAALNLGGAFHDDQTLLTSRRLSEMTWGAAASYDFEFRWLGLMAEIVGGTTFGLAFDSEAPTELRGAALFHIDDVHIEVGGGAGLAYAIGVPVGRVTAGISWIPSPARDTDGDRLADGSDACPAEREDVDGFDDDDGCPDADNDEDGVLDGSDRCPTDPEDRDEHEDEDGCPDTDDDGDGVLDGYDSCPRTPEDVDGDRDTDGCPDSDRDRDRIADDVDRCPDEAEDTDGFADEDGCPEVDFDGDGVEDEADECPDVAEDRDGHEDSDGCPEEAGPGEGGRRHRGR